MVGGGVGDGGLPKYVFQVDVRLIHWWWDLRRGRPLGKGSNRVTARRFPMVSDGFDIHVVAVFDYTQAVQTWWYFTLVYLVVGDYAAWLGVVVGVGR